MPRQGILLLFSMATAINPKNIKLNLKNIMDVRQVPCL